MNEQELREAIAWLDACLRQIHTEHEGRALDDDTQTRFDEGIAERNRLHTQLEQVVARREQVAGLAQVPARIESGDGATGGADPSRDGDPFDLSEVRFGAPVSEFRGRALSAVESMDGLTDAHRARATELIERRDPSGALARHVLATGSADYRSAWQKVLAGASYEITAEEARALTVARAQSLSGPDGGYTVPVTLDPTVILSNDGSSNPFRQIATQRSIVTSTWQGVTTAGVTAGFAAEAAEAVDGSMTLDNPTVTAHKAHSFVPFSVEVGGDWRAIEEDIRDAIVDAKDNLEATKFAVGAGDGSDEPFGVVTSLAAAGGSVIVSPTTAETFAVADLYKMEEALGDRWLANASWVGHRSIFNRVRQFDTQGGANLWERLGAGQPPELIGYPRYRSSAMDSTLDASATAAHNYLLILGDFSQYLIVDRVGMSIELVPHLFGANGRPTGQRGFYAWWRVGADVRVPGAFRMLDIPTTA